jgi:hypothetical protein
MFFFLVVCTQSTQSMFEKDTDLNKYIFMHNRSIYSRVMYLYRTRQIIDKNV